jgi:hypothetical protein
LGGPRLRAKKETPKNVRSSGFQVAAEGLEPARKKTGFPEQESESGPPGGPLSAVSEIAEALAGLSPEALAGIAALAAAIQSQAATK